MSDPAAALLGESPAMVDVRAAVRANARHQGPVLIIGEPGTGKNLVAQTLHALSSRADAAFVEMHCAAIVEEVFDAQLFGLVLPNGEVRPGAVERAAGGTLFINAIDALGLTGLEKLERFIATQEYSREGSIEVRKADLRLLMSRDRENGRMQQLARISLPPLRERIADLPLLVNHFLAFYGPREGHAEVTITPGALTALETRYFGGNVRELGLFLWFLFGKAPAGDFVIDERMIAGRSAEPAPVKPRSDGVEELRPAVEAAMDTTGGDRTAAARLLKMTRRTFGNLLEALGLGRGDL